MSVEKIIVAIIAALFQSIATTFLLCKQISCSDKKKISKFLLFAFLYFILGYLFVPNAVRFIVFIISISLITFFVMKIKDLNSVIYAFNAEMILAVSEIFISLVLVSVGINSKEIVTNSGYNLIANILISILAVLIMSLEYIRKLLAKEIEILNKKRVIKIYILIIFLAVYFLVLKNGFEFLAKSNYYINILFILFSVLLLTMIMRNELKYNQLEEENKNMLNYVTKYEKIITEKGKANHEFKNQLMVIRGYAQMNSPKLIEYIDSLTVDANKTYSSYLISQLNKFPDGGLKGLLYYKLSIMEDCNISYDINVENGVKTKLKNLSVKEHKNLTKILGVLLDNAIDASKKCKNKKIIIEVSMEKNKIIFNIQNTYKGDINLNMIGTGYSAKGKGHGFGLRLVKDIIEKEEIFELENKVEDGYYVSELKIKKKKINSN